ncbi:pentatricopeptide repeat-containing protein At3g24000, mitochondrial [Amborella trichopoda]|uniref:pentatricopeptide repeat-containing protein At3g24000, mitochondrial n=1 Tax=Amborella trichopoda TaxID=13333 RepID=UPI0005D2F1AE|nr:pentatricopeptide repeat-containing protein At3g24000, mitochondrial [Amborella trichopoda]|eukprot:XP_011628337.1 pentatricopeptide repeat-containing protein At3g24000, mitochondrial [Amborella trichopoda]
MAPNHFSFSSVLKACAGLKTLDASKQIHCLSIKTGFCLDLVVGNALVDAYSKCEYMDEAWRVFDEMPNKDEISWTTLIVGYSQNCMGNEALSAFKLLRNRGVDPDQYMLASVISGCGAITSEIHGRQLHSYSIKVGFGSSLFVQNALVDMYSKNGSIKSAHKVFGFMENRDVVSWTSLIVGLAQHGMGEKALFLFDQMRMAHVKPNHVTFVGVLSACSHVGLVDKGLFYFELMSKDYGIEPGYDHFVCMVDLLGRVGNLEEAKKFIDELPIPPGPLVWQTFLGACKLHGNVKLGKLAATHVLELSPHDSSVYVLLSNMHAEAGLWEEAARVRNMMRERGARKEVAYSWIEVRRKVHKFVVRESMHPEVEEINELLKVLLRHMEVDGYAHNGQSALRGDAE